MSYSIEVRSGSTVRLPTKGKACYRDIVITATGGEVDTSVEDALLTGTLQEYTNERIIQLRGYAFVEQRGLESVTLPNAELLEGYNFYYCTELMSVDISSTTQIPQYAFEGCKLLRMLCLPMVTQIARRAFYGCKALNTLVLRSPQVVTLSSQDAFMQTLFQTSGGRIYVPQELIESYQAATNWSALYAAGACEFLPL